MRKKFIVSAISAALLAAMAVPFSLLPAAADDDTDAVGEEVVEENEEQEIIIGEDSVISDDFDNGKIGKWVPFGGGTLSVDDHTAHSGDKSLHITGRNRSYQGPSYITDVLFVPGQSYSCDGWVYHEGSEPVTISWTLKHTNALGADDFSQIKSLEVPPFEWVNLNGVATIPDDTVASRIYFESSDETADFNIDSITVVGKMADDDSGNADALPDKQVFDFESGTDGWGTRGDMRVILSDEFGYTGTHSIYSTNRSSVWNGPILCINDLVKKNMDFYYSAYVMYNGDQNEASHVFRLELQYTLDGADCYETVATAEVKKGKWTELAGYHNIPIQAENLYLYVQTDNLENGGTPDADDLMSFYVDNVTITKGEIMQAYTRKRRIIIISVSVALAAIIIFVLYKMIKKTIRNNAAIQLASVDAMTRMLNRNAYEKRTAAMTEDPSLCKGLYFALCDVNFLKHINDNYGHEKGDEAILRCAKMLKRIVGSNGEVYRIGGDEFVVMSKAPIKEDILNGAQSEAEKYKGYPFAVACGFSKYSEPDRADIKSIIAACDKEMYAHKKKIKAENKDFSRN